MKNCLFIGFFLVFFAVFVSAEERNYCKVGGDPNPAIALTSDEEIVTLTEDFLIPNKGGSGKIYDKCWSHKGRQIVIDKATGKMKRFADCYNPIIGEFYAERKIYTATVEEEKISQQQPQVVNNYYVAPAHQQQLIPYYNHRSQSYPVIYGDYGWSQGYNPHYYGGSRTRWITVDTHHHHKKPVRHHRHSYKKPQPRQRTQPQHPSPPRVP